ncbi:MAG: S8 family serine peptidase, partial [Myxococcota bacterium]
MNAAVRMLSISLALFVGLVSGLASAQSRFETADWTDEASWDVPGQYVVDFADDESQSRLAGLVEALAPRISLRWGPLADETKIAVLDLGGARASSAAGELFRALRRDAEIEAIEPLSRVRAMLVPDDPYYEQQWHMPKVGGPVAWAGSIARGVTVAVVDTGIACETFKEFNKATDLALTPCVPGKSFVRPGGHASDDHGHGTHVAGT